MNGRALGRHGPQSTAETTAETTGASPSPNAAEGATGDGGKLERPRPRRRFGQNFLCDRTAVARIVQQLPRSSEQVRLIEIGPGHGVLTDALLARGDTLHCLELDRDLAALLRQRPEARQEPRTLEIHSGDAARFDYHTLAEDGLELAVFGNLPYNAAMPILMRLLQQNLPLAPMHFMLQKEVAQRLTARTGNRPYARLTVAVGLHCRVQSLFVLGPSCFRPAPKVYSSFVRLTPVNRECMPPAQPFATLLTQAFRQPRKTLANNLGRRYADALEMSAIDGKKRPAELSVEDYIHLCMSDAENRR